METTLTWEQQQRVRFYADLIDTAERERAYFERVGSTRLAEERRRAIEGYRVMVEIVTNPA